MVTAIGEAAWAKLNAASDPLTDSDLEALSPMVVIAPHPDDETLGCGGLLSIAAGLGLEPRVVYLTDGSASHPQSKAWPPPRLAGERRREALAALAVLGVPEHRVMFLDWPDAAPLKPGKQDYDKSIGGLLAWMSHFNPKSVWAPRMGEPHCDHEAASLLADALVKQAGGRLRRMDYMVWGWADDAVAAPRGDERLWRLSCGHVTPQRRRALACHRTQMTDLIADAEEAFLIPADLAALVERPAEIFLERP